MCKAIIILGHRLLPDNSPSEDLKSRIDTAVAYWKETGIPLIMPCGGITRDRTRSEADVMREMLIARGVPESVIRLENESRTTAENMENAVKLLGKGAEVAMVSSEYHMEYALAECAYYGLQASFVPAPTADPVYREQQHQACLFFMNMNAIVREEAKKAGTTPEAMMEEIHKTHPTREEFHAYLAEQAAKRGIKLPEF